MIFSLKYYILSLNYYLYSRLLSSTILVTFKYFPEFLLQTHYVRDQVMNKCRWPPSREEQKGHFESVILCHPPPTNFSDSKVGETVKLEKYWKFMEKGESRTIFTEWIFCLFQFGYHTSYWTLDLPFFSQNKKWYF